MYNVVIRVAGKKEVFAKFEQVIVKMDYTNKILRIENSEEIFTKSVFLLKITHLINNILKLFFEDNCFHTFDENGDAIQIVYHNFYKTRKI